MARDAGFGASGGSLLVLGFVFQSLQYFGVRTEHHSAAAVAVAVASTILGALVYAWLAFGAAYLVAFRSTYLG